MEQPRGLTTIVTLMYMRMKPRVGQSVTVVFFAAHTDGTVVAVDPDLRGLEVATEDGEVLRFVLQRATGRFQSGGQTGARLYFRHA